MSNSIVPIGCVSTKDSRKAGFTDVRQITGSNINVKNINECISYAKTAGSSCQGKCDYVVFKNADIWDELREANKLSNQYINSETPSGKRDDYYKNESIKHFKNAFKSISSNERVDFNTNFYGYKPRWWDNEEWMPNNKKTRSVRSFFENITQPVVASDLHTCWIGGKNVINNKNVNPLNLENPNQKIDCKSNLGLYITPGFENGDSLSAAYMKYFKNKKDKLSKKFEKSEREFLVAKALEEYSKQNPNMGLTEILTKAKDIRKNVENEYNNRGVSREIKVINAHLNAKKEPVKMVNILTETNNKAIYRNKKLLKDKEKVSKKITSDLQSLNWSLRESEDKEKLQNKITSLLSVIIILFSVLFIGFILYKMIGKVSKSSSTNISNKGIIDSIFNMK